jgi:GT2 family glycosyltransferase
MNTIKRIGVVIINFNGEKDTIECLESLLKTKTSGREILICVVDNASRAESVTYLTSHIPKTKAPFTIQVLKEKENKGFTGGNNVGMHYVITKGVDAIVILNNDTTVDPELIENLSKGLEDHVDAGIVVPKIYFAKGHEYHKDRYKESERGKVIWYAGGEIDMAHVIGKHRGVDEVDKGQFDKEIQTLFATGCCFIIRKEVIGTVGIFDNDYFLYFEDADLSERVRRAGFTIYYEPKAILWHKNAGSTGGSGSQLQDYYTTRNRLLFGMEYAPFRTKAALMKEAMRLLKNGREWQRIGVQDYLRHRLGKGTYASGKD